MRTALEIRTYVPALNQRNKSSTRYKKLLNRFKRVEDRHKEAIIAAGSELQEITRVESRFRKMVIKTPRTDSVATSNVSKLDPKSKEIEGIRASSSVNSVRNNTYHHNPTSSRIRVD